MSIFPKQKTTLKEKTTPDKDGRTWGMNCVDYLVDETITSTDRDDILALNRLVDNGEMAEQDYSHVLNPLNTTKDRYKRFPAKLKNYDILTPVINLYAGEFSKRFKNITVLDSNPEDENNYKKGLNQMVKQYYDQQTVNNLNTIGINTGQESVEQPPIKNAIDAFNENFDSEKVINGQAILDYIIFDQDADDKYQEAYLDWLKSGISVTYKGIHHNDVDLEVVPPWEITLAKAKRNAFIEDSQWVTRRQIMTSNQIIDRWRTSLSEEDITYLEEKDSQEFLGSGGFVRLPTKWINKGENNSPNYLEEVNGHEVYHTQWRSFRKVGKLTYIGLLGKPITKEVDDTYVLNKAFGDLHIEWEWISQVWEGWKVEGDRPIYLDVQALPYNRMELNNSSAQKLSYNGRINRATNGTLISLISIGRPYQVIYNILKYQFEKIINKNKDKIAVIPQGLIPKGINGWDEEKFMYMATAGSMMVVDETQPTAGIAMQGIKVLDLSLGQYAEQAIKLMQDVKAEWWEAIGMNRQRYGDSKASDGKGVTEQAIFRSAIISEELNRKFEKFQEKDYAGLLDLSKLAYIEGKKGKYVNSDSQKAFLKINPDDAVHHLNSDYNIFVKKSSQETENIQLAKEYAFSMGQNADAPTMMELIGSTNFEKTKKLVNKMDALNKQQQEASQQAVLDNNKEVATINQATQDSKNEIEKYKADKDYDKIIDAKQMDIDHERSQTDNTDDTETVSIQDRHKMSKEDEKLALERKKHQQTVKEGNQKILESKAKVRQLNKPVTSNN